MTQPADLQFLPMDLDALAVAEGAVAVFVDPAGKLDAGARKVNTLTRKAVERLVAGDGFAKGKEGDVFALAYPAGMAAEKLLVAKCGRRPDVATARKTGAELAKARGQVPVLLAAGGLARVQDVALGLVLRGYSFDRHKTSAPMLAARVDIMVARPDDIAADQIMAVAQGVFLTRDLTSEPANVLTTTAFADRLAEMQDLGLKVEVLEEDALAQLGMGSLLCVGQGSASPSKVVVMQWNGGGEEKPFALVGKGVVFDTGGISIKPAAGMEEMTMDMGGAAVVAGVMRTLASRGAKANVVGLVGIVENMPSGEATRPGDVVTSMKGDTIEVINTDAEGRLVLADVLWYAQERFAPVGMINLATLTGAIIIALGHENAGVFGNSDALAADFLAAAQAEGEGAWRMPMGPAYDTLIRSQIADIKNTGGRPAGSVTAAQFLGRFVRDDVPWCHLDIAGVARTPGDTTLAPKGCTGWGVMSLNRLIADHYEA